MADPHLGVVLFSAPGTRSRATDMAATLERFADVSIQEHVEAALLVGDIFNSRRPDPSDQAALVRTVEKLRKAGIPTIITPGNHDGSDVVGSADSQTLQWLALIDIPDVRVFLVPTAAWIKTASGADLGIVAVPYPHPRMYDMVAPTLSSAERVQAISKDLEISISALADQMLSNPKAKTAPVIFMGHLTAIGAMPGSESTMKLGWDVAVGSHILDKFDYAALGHIHRQQQIGQKAWYPGSPEYIKFVEAGSSKGFLIADVARGKLPEVRVVDAGTRPMVIVEIVESEAGWSVTPDIDPIDAIIHLNIRPLVSIDEREVERTKRTYFARGASYVRHEIIVPDVPIAAVSQISSSLDPAEALTVWLSENGFDPEPYRSLGIELLRETGVLRA